MCPRCSATRSTPRAAPAPIWAQTGPPCCAGRWIAVAEGLQAQAARAYANLHSISCDQRRFDEADRYFADGVAYCDEHDIGTYGTALRGARADALENLGRWEESASLSEELLMRSGTSPVNRIKPLTSLGKIRARRGTAGCWECLDEAAAAADGSGEPQYIMFVRLARAEAYWLEGQPDPAARGKPSWPMTPAPAPTRVGPRGGRCAGPAARRFTPAAALRPRRALPAGGGWRLGGSCPVVDRPGLPVRGRAGPARRV